MPDYIPDPNDSKKQIPGTTDYGDRLVAVPQHSMSKTPNYVLIGNITGDVGFFFGSSASFSSTATTEGGNFSISQSGNFINFGSPSAGSRIDINPTTWSGSVGDVVTFVYRRSLDGMGKV